MIHARFLMNVFILFIFFSLPSFAFHPKHMIKISPIGLGGDASVEGLQSDNDSKYNNATYWIHNISLNYAFLIAPRWQLGAYYKASENKQVFDRKGTGKTTSKRNTTSFGAFIIYNFSPELVSCYYLGLTTGRYNQEEQVSLDFAQDEGKVALEFDDDGENYGLFVGKRFSLKILGIKNISYSPQLTFFYNTHGKDLRDQGLRKGKGLSIEPLKLDILF